MTAVNACLRLIVVGLLTCGNTGCEPGQNSPRSGPVNGAIVYQVCLGCHGSDGRGVTGQIAPDLVGSPVVLGDPTPLIQLVLHGIENDGRWPGLMLPWRDALSDQQIAAVLTYIRTQWGHDATAVEPDEVADVREATAERVRPYPRAELGIIAPERE